MLRIQVDNWGQYVISYAFNAMWTYLVFEPNMTTTELSH